MIFCSNKTRIFGNFSPPHLAQPSFVLDHSLIATTVYPDENSAMAVTGHRKAWIDTFADILINTFFYEGEVAFTSHKESIIVGGNDNLQNRADEKSKIRNPKQEVRELKEIIRRLSLRL